ncbi:hypothetical protein [Alteromonas sp. KUL49]|nr:hypothetical protein [Alteromonas sp. KUL49]GEA13536.1 hypothetical protein KUL49_39110 [Alteromonas sp. KUL49]
MKKSSVVAVLFSSAALICSIALGPSLSTLTGSTNVAYVETTASVNVLDE